MDKKTVKVSVKTQYGKERIFAECETAKKFLALTGTIEKARGTFSRSDLSVIEALGFSIEFVPQTVSIPAEGEESTEGEL